MLKADALDALRDCGGTEPGTMGMLVGFFGLIDFGLIDFGLEEGNALRGLALTDGMFLDVGN